MNIHSEKTDIEPKLNAPAEGAMLQELTAPIASEQKTGLDAANQSDDRPREYTNSERWLLGHPLAWNVSPPTLEEGVRYPSRAKEDDRLSQLSFDEVLSILHDESKKNSQQRINSVAIALGFLVFALLMAKFAHNTYFLSLRSVCISMIVVGWVVVSDRHKAAAAAIARFDDVRAIGPLAEALGLKNRSIRQIASRTLIRLLPRVQASDSVYLGPPQRHALNRTLRGKNIDLTLAILKAWEQIGDADAIPEVEKLAEGRGYGGRVPKVSAAAHACLPYLRQSAGRQQIGAQLLRPADTNALPSGTLLRPALPHTSSEPSAQLLRPTDPT